MQVRRCDEMERKLRFLEKEIKKDSIPMMETTEPPDAPQPRQGRLFTYEYTITGTDNYHTVKAGNVVTFGAQNNFFLRISCRWPNVICSYKIQLKKGLDVGMAIFGFCQHLGPFF